MPRHTINHGKDILREMHAQTFKGKAKTLLGKIAGRFVFWSGAILFFVGGFCAADNIITFVY